MKKSLYYLPLAGMLFAACSTTQKLGIPNDFVAESNAPTLEEEIQQNETDENNFLIQEEVKVQDVENTVVYIDRPVYVPETKQSDNDYKKLTGIEAVTDSQKRATQKPENYKSGTFFYQFNENFVYVRWWRNRTGRTLSPPQIHQKNT